MATRKPKDGQLRISMIYDPTTKQVHASEKYGQINPNLAGYFHSPEMIRFERAYLKFMESIPKGVGIVGNKLEITLTEAKK